MKGKLFIGCLLVLGLVVCGPPGCVHKKAKQEKDPFLTKWQTKAKVSKPASPKVRPPEEELVPGEVPAPEIEEPERALPKDPISLDMRGNTDVRVVLKAIAKSVGLNLVISENVKGTFTSSIQQVPWDQAFLSILSTLGLKHRWIGNIVNVYNVADVERQLRIEEAEKDITTSKPMIDRVVPVYFADAKEMSDTIVRLFGLETAKAAEEKKGRAKGSVVLDKHGNKLLIHDLSENVAKIERMIRQLDVPSKQVLIKAEIVEATRGIARDLGIQWGGMGMRGVGSRNHLWVTPGGLGAGSPTAAIPGDLRTGPGYTAATQATGLSGHGFGINFPGAGLTTGSPAALGLMFGQIGGNILEVQLKALQEARKVNIVSSPSITTMDGLKAIIESGRDVPYQSVDDSGQIKTEYKSAVLKLDVTPIVISEEVVKLDIELSKDEPDFTTTVQGNPLIIKKQAKTTLVLYSGETAVIAGLNTQTKRKSGSGIPWLSDVPILGWIFKESGRSEELDDLLVFVTPTILPLRDIRSNKEPVPGSFGPTDTQQEGPKP